MSTVCLSFIEANNELKYAARNQSHKHKKSAGEVLLTAPALHLVAF